MAESKIKTKEKKNSERQPHIAEDARKTVVKNKENTRSLSERRQKKSVISSELRSKSAFSSSASGLPSRTGKSQKIKADVYDIKGKVVEEIELPSEIFGTKVNKNLIAQAVRVYLANQRRGTSSTKTRGEVQGSTRKIYRQKGTGRARHGGIRAPIFVHGGIAFGPKPRDYSLDLPKKMKKAALFSALSAKVKDGEIKIVDGLEKLQPKTKLMVEVINNLNLSKKGILLVLPKREDSIDRAARNIEGIEMILASNLNTYEVLQSRTLLFARDSIDVLTRITTNENTKHHEKVSGS